MKLRITQDNTAITYPWYKLQRFNPSGNIWQYINSGSDMKELVALADRLLAAGDTEVIIKEFNSDIDNQQSIG